LPATAATLAVAALYALLPGELLLGPRLVVPVVELVLLVPLVIVNPNRMTRETRWSRMIAIGLDLVVIATNLYSLVALVYQLVNSDAHDPKRLLVAALQVWLTNLLAFALLFWELDRGGAVARAHAQRGDLQAADFRFSQDENDDAVAEVSRGASKTSGWIPTFVDYFYVSLTNSSAFSPTDTMPLSSRAKLLMATEATAALITSLLVVARAVGTLQS